MLIQNIYKQNQILLDLVIDMRAELEVFRTTFFIQKFQTENKSDDELKKFSETYHSMIQESRKTALAQIKAHYLMDDNADDLLNSALSDE